MPASQDFRDGAAKGAHELADRTKLLLSWGVRVSPETLEALANGITDEYGGRYFSEAFKDISAERAADKSTPEPESDSPGVDTTVPFHTPLETFDDLVKLAKSDPDSLIGQKVTVTLPQSDPVTPCESLLASTWMGIGNFVTTTGLIKCGKVRPHKVHVHRSNNGTWMWDDARAYKGAPPHTQMVVPSGVVETSFMEEVALKPPAEPKPL